MSSNARWLLGLVVLIAVVSVLSRPRSVDPATAEAVPSPAPSACAPSGKIVGTVLDATSRKPVAGAEVSLNTRVDTEKKNSTDARGRFRFDGVAAGQHTVLAAADEYRITRPERNNIREAAVTAGQTVDVGAIELVRGARLDVTIDGLDSEGYASIVLDPVSGDGRQLAPLPRGKGEAHMVNAPDGRWLVGVGRAKMNQAFEMEHVWYYPGTYDRTKAKPVDLVFKRAARVRISLPPGF